MKLACITGGAQGIGRAIALRFAAEGCAVSIADKDGKACAETRAILKARGAEALVVRADVAKEKDVRGWMARTVKTLGGPDVLVNNAGIMHRESPRTIRPRDFDRVIAVNLRATFLCSQEAARVMKRGGAIVNIASTRAYMSEAGTEGYTASKGGIAALTHGLAISLGPRIRVNGVAPGWIEVGDWQAGAKKAVRHSKTDRAQHPVGRVGRPEDIAEAVLFLADPKRAGFITGQTLIVDGGMTVKMIYAE